MIRLAIVNTRLLFFKSFLSRICLKVEILIECANLPSHKQLANLDFAFAAADCPANYRTVATSCMRLTSIKGNFSEVETACNNMGARLVKINDPGTRQVVSAIFVGAWTGKSFLFP